MIAPHIVAIVAMQSLHNNQYFTTIALDYNTTIVLK